MKWSKHKGEVSSIFNYFLYLSQGNSVRKSVFMEDRIGFCIAAIDMCLLVLSSQPYDNPVNNPSVVRYGLVPLGGHVYRSSNFR
jgi:hypothetical protein